MENKKLQEDSNGLSINNFDFYIEHGKYVFTEEYHIRRGVCCGSGCRHCPFDPTHTKGNRNIHTSIKK
jgi:hypothetical protein